MTRGSLRIYLGAAPGVGKTYRMLDEAYRRRERGADVVVGVVETHGRAATTGMLRDLEVVPRHTVRYRGVDLDEMDLDAVLARRPDVVLVDEIAHTNVPGSRHTKRWEDVEELREAGIDVVSTLNIQHLESINDVVARITGITQRETIPDAVVRAADQVELVDMTPEGIRRRMAHGNIYPSERVDAALANYFRPGNLGALRELALLWVADRVDESLHDYMVAHGIADTWETRERILVALSGAPGSHDPIRRAARMARRAKADLLGVYVRSQDGLAAPSPVALEDQQRLLAEVGGQFREVVGDDPASALLQVARAENVTQIVLGASRRSRWAELVRGSVINDVIRHSGPVDVHVISSETDDTPGRLPSRRTRLAPLSRRRRVLGLAIGAIGLPALTLLLVALGDAIDLSSVLLLYLAVTVAAGVVGGLLAGVVTALGGFALGGFYFTAPFKTFVVYDADVVVALVVFLAIAVTVSTLVDQAARRQADATRARAEAAALARLSSTLLDTPEPLPRLVRDLRATFGLDAVAVLRRDGDGWVAEAGAGEPLPRQPKDGTDVLDLDDERRLVLTGPRTPGEDRRVLAAFAAQLAVAIHAQGLAERAAEATVRAQANEMRSALLSAVSHDLRTPLAAIKAWATSLLATDVTFSPADTREILDDIVAESDRLDDLVGNLLDMSRLQAGGLVVAPEPVGLEEIVPGALAGHHGGRARVDVDLPADLPPVVADPPLLERVVANLVGNALRWSPADTPVRIDACRIPDRVELRVVDRGPGIPDDARDRVFEPFQRLGDGGGRGVGLGLAAARGFTEAMGGTLTVEDTPGGGTTMVVNLRAAT